MSISDLESIAVYIENQKKSVFKFIENKKLYAEYHPYENYYAKKFRLVHFLTLHKKTFTSAIDRATTNLKQD
ncbi:hypothetical protein PVA17_21525 [Lysinibacillus sp. CNPSo 3705]|uniref:hypothetical protein n=1 Tax=Lysinibacillus sp. CNPSo 3705 TaxID=3028148 RepID=UPI0023643197|nr:hypothetical protein [Lysinibacillus sp. CNPSo 3705]MDD1505304.1 hypothetical protein [Lysinibacillus sp. CNPSo 3705]